MPSTEALLALNMLEQVGPITVRRLLETFEHPEKILAASEATLKRLDGVSEPTAYSIAHWETQINLADEIERCRAFGCEILTEHDAAYPPRLKQIYDPPLVLYVKGQLTSRDHSSVAIVGSRQTTHYGREVARKLSYQLASAGLTVVSGGARGIDSSAHQGALAGQGRTICVLGNGINRVYPPENRQLFDRIVENGALITQFPFDRPADRQSFPIRNRIVAGMSLGTVVVEANASSGAMITANMASDYNREVFAVPGQINSPRSKGCHRLIKQGAKLCESAEDILTEFEYLFPSSRQTGSEKTPDLRPEERQLLGLIDGQETHIDDIVRQSGLSVAAVSVSLLQLEMKGLIAQQPGHLYSTTMRG